MEGQVAINFYKSAGRGIQNMFISKLDGSDGVRYENVDSPKKIGECIQNYLEAIMNGYKPVKYE